MIRQLSTAVLLAAPALSQTIVRVDIDAPGSVQDGTAWDKAYTTLQSGLAAHPVGDVEFWIAEGVYIDPTVQSFVLAEDQEWYGAFIGYDPTGTLGGNETSLATRAGSIHGTVLSGDQDGSDTATDGDTNRVISLSPPAAPLNPAPWRALDSLLIKCGEGAVFGAGIGQSSPTLDDVALRVNNCLIRDCRATSSGGGIGFSVITRIEVTNTVVRDNHADVRGGGIHLGLVGDDAGVLDARCEIWNTRVVKNSGEENCGIYVGTASNCDVVLKNCLVARNVNSFPDTLCSAVHLRSASDIGGGLRKLSISHCTINDNVGTVGVYTRRFFGIQRYTLDVTSSVVWDNVSPLGVLVNFYGEETDGADVSYTCTSYVNSAAWAPNTGNLFTDPLFAGPNSSRLGVFSPCLDAASDGPLVTDYLDVDGDGNTAEAIDIDLVGEPREQDFLTAPNVGLNVVGDNSRAISDMGCFERTSNATPQRDPL